MLTRDNHAFGDIKSTINRLFVSQLAGVTTGRPPPIGLTNFCINVKSNPRMHQNPPFSGKNSNFFWGGSMTFFPEWPGVELWSLRLSCATCIGGRIRPQSHQDRRSWQSCDQQFHVRSNVSMRHKSHAQPKMDHNRILEGHCTGLQSSNFMKTLPS